MKVDGGCHCGHIKFEADVNPETAGIPAEKRPRQNQVPRARHRQELGEPLHYSEQRSRN